MIDWLEGKPWVELLKDPKIVHYSTRSGHQIDAIFIHYTAGSHYKNSTWKWWLDPVAQASAHCIVGRAPGEVCQCVPFSVRAWHSGNSRIPGVSPTGESKVISPADLCAIGIEVANFGPLIKEGDKFFYVEGQTKKEYRLDRYSAPEEATLFYNDGNIQKEVSGWWEPYPNSQVADVASLTAEIILAFNIPLHRVVGHEDVAYPELRKTDPGPLWPWKSFMTQVSALVGKTLPVEVWKLHKTIR